MKFKTIKHQSRIVSCLSESMADRFKDRVTGAQYNVLRHNVYTIEKGDLIEDKYRGCGSGWVEFDQEGHAVDLQYINDDVAVMGVEYYGDEEVDIIVVPSKDKQIEYMTTGQPAQNDSLNLRTDQLAPLILPNGNIRVLVNLSSYQLVRF